MTTDGRGLASSVERPSQQSDVRRRSRSRYLALLVATIAVGLATRRVPHAFPAVVAEYGGDALWASMVFWGGALLRPRLRTWELAAGALACSYVVEISQLYHAPWIDAIRATGAGTLVLGQGFLWSDLVAYAIGVLAAATLDAALLRREVALADT